MNLSKVRKSGDVVRHSRTPKPDPSSLFCSATSCTDTKHGDERLICHFHHRSQRLCDAETCTSLLATSRELTHPRSTESWTGLNFNWHALVHKDSKNIGAFPLMEEAQEVIHAYCGIIFNIIFSILASEPDWEISSSFVVTNNFEWLSCLYFKNSIVILVINSGFLIKVSRAACLVMGNWQSAPMNLIGTSLKRKCIIQFMEPLFSGMSVI